MRRNWDNGRLVRCRLCGIRERRATARVKPVECPCPPHRRPSWDSWIRPSLTDARPSPVRQKSVGRLVCRPSEARCASVSRRAICRRARTPHEPTQDERHTGRDRTQNEQPTNTDAPARQATLSSPQKSAARQSPVYCPCPVRSVSVCRPFCVRGGAVRSPSVVCPFAARFVSVICPRIVRSPSVCCPLLDRGASVSSITCLW